MPNGHLYLYVLDYVPTTGSPFSVLYYSVAEPYAYFRDQVANLACSSNHELIFYVVGGLNMAGYDWDPMNDTNCREFKFVETSAKDN